MIVTLFNDLKFKQGDDKSLIVETMRNTYHVNSSDFHLWVFVNVMKLQTCLLEKYMPKYPEDFQGLHKSFPHRTRTLTVLDVTAHACCLDILKLHQQTTGKAGRRILHVASVLLTRLEHAPMQDEKIPLCC